jgi:antitoxin VapB
MGVHETRTFKSGNSEAVRLPKGMGFGIGTEVRVERDEAGRLILTAVADREAQRRAMDRAYAAMLAIGAPADGVQPRDPFEFIERPVLE